MQSSLYLNDARIVFALLEPCICALEKGKTWLSNQSDPHHLISTLDLLYYAISIYSAYSLNF